MNTPNIKQIARMMERALADRIDDGDIDPEESAAMNAERFFGFSAADVAGIHTHKTGFGDGVWYRLKDGRVFNNYAEPSEPNPVFYDTVKN